MDKKIAIITGASKGIGKSLAALLLKENYVVVNASRSEPQENNNTVFIKTDITKEEECEKTINKVINDFGRVDLLVNNAGVLFKDTVENLDKEKMIANTETNVFGMFYCSHYVIKQMRKQGYGQIVNISSSSGISFREGHASYIASKWAVVGLSGSMRMELEKYGIDVICFCPGGTKTELFRHDAGIDISDYLDPEEVAKKILEAIKRKDKEKWLFTYNRKEKELKCYGFDEYPLI